MFLKSLSMKGFKSFAESTALDLQPGVTVVVGPNGSGKSNVVDAIGWVLGAQAPSTVRSQKMDDVIFAGSASRPALGRAEVTLTIDNAAGLLPIEFTEVTISRTLFRSGESEYALNGVPCRLLDVQDLLSDTGVGRQQHTIISQGQIDSVLNSRPEDRRLIIEEAAGVLKYRKRKEKSERRLASTEANLTRIQDLLREVRRQLRPLEKQAEAARRHGDLLNELTTLKIHSSGRDLRRLRTHLEQLNKRQGELSGEDRDLRERLSALDSGIMQTESRLTAMGGDDLGDSLAGYESARQRARGQLAVLVERRRGLERDRASFVQQEVVVSLESDKEVLVEELRGVGAQGDELARDLTELDSARAALQNDLALLEGQSSEHDRGPGAEAAELRGEQSALRGSIQRGESDCERVHKRLGFLRHRADRLEAEAQGLRQELADAEQAEMPLVARLEAVEGSRHERQELLNDAEAAARRAEGEHNAWTARVEALTVARDEARCRSRVDELAGVEGVAGALIDLVDIDDGWAAAVEAAAGEALQAIVVEDAPAARRAFGSLLTKEAAGAVLQVPQPRAGTEPADFGEPVRRHVRGRSPGVDALLDFLLAKAVLVQGPWTAAADLALSNPGWMVVTREGHLFGPGGWRVGGEPSSSTEAALAEARERSKGTASLSEAARERVAQAKVALESVRREEAAVSRHLDANDSRLAAAADGLQRIETDRLEAQTEIEAQRAHLDDLCDRVQREKQRMAEVQARLPLLEAAESESEDRSRKLAEARAKLDERSNQITDRHTELGIRAAGLDERKQLLERRIAEIDERLAGLHDQREAAARRTAELGLREAAIERLSAFVAGRLEAVEHELEGLRQRRRRQSEEVLEVTARLEDLRAERETTEKRLEEVRELLQRAGVDDAETRLRIETATEQLRHELDCEPEAAMVAACPPLEEGVTVASRIRELERELRLMGPINPLALHEHEVLGERHEFLKGQLDDVRQTRRDLNKVIRAIDAEIVNVFAAAYADVAANFEELFETLFPGGRGRLRLTEPDDLLHTGIEIEAKPSGKNVRRLSLLSGGERSLTALAFLFAVFRSRPSPFYVMDEVEAALDDVNLHRFLELVNEFRESAQLLIVSHQKRTMEAADVLYGVTMEPGGSSKVVSERVSAVVAS